MQSKLWRRRAGNLTQSDLAVLDQLLEAWPGYEMVDDYNAVKRLCDREYIEASVRMDGEVGQAVYRITALGAHVYAMVSPAPRVGIAG